jgi:hypothetical protein
MTIFLKQLFSESGEASFSRVRSFVALLCSCFWVTDIVMRTGNLPGLDGLTFFIGSLYGLGKAGETCSESWGASREGMAAKGFEI